MNRAHKLFDKEYILALLGRKVFLLYPKFKSIVDLKIIPHKKHIWDSTYHVVVEYEVKFETKKGAYKVLSIFCSAHSEENREDVFKALTFLWDNGFSSQHLTIPRPLFFSPYLNGTFYRGVVGRNLRYYMSKHDEENINKIIPQAAKWLVRLHSLENKAAHDFNKASGAIKTVIPGIDNIFSEISVRYPHLLDFYKKVYSIFIKNEEDFFNSTDQRWFIHGDAHPENIIKVNDVKTAVIDFTDMSLSDFARDLGCFLQQLEYMGLKCNLDPEIVNRGKALFLEQYFANSGEKLDAGLQARIDNYYNWTMMRTINYLLTSGTINRDEAKMQRINTLISQLKNNLGI